MKETDRRILRILIPVILEKDPPRKLPKPTPKVVNARPVTF